MLADTNNYKHFKLQIIAEKVLFKIIYAFIVIKFCKQITELQKRDLFLNKI